MQDLASVQNLNFLEVVGFPIGLSSRTMQDLGSVQNLHFLEVVGVPIGLSREPCKILVLSKTYIFLK